MNAEAVVKNIIEEENIQPGWNADIKLGFIQKDGKTILNRRTHQGPLIVQRPFYPEGGLCHVYLLHPPGGVVAGDRLSIDVHVDSEAEALLTTPGAGKIYRSVGKQALQKVSLQINEDAALEWLPQETLIYEGAKLASETSIDLAENARFIGWEILALGRPASGEGFELGEVQVDWKIYRAGKPLFLEKINLDAKAFAANWGLNGYSSCGTLFASCATEVNLEVVRSIINDKPGLGVTLIDDLLICRASADKARTVRNFFERVRAEIRHDIVRHKSITPRIWST